MQVTPFPIPDISHKSRYAECRASARRARLLLYGGAQPLVPTEMRKPEAIAVLEVRSGACTYQIRPKPKLFLVPKADEVEVTPEPEAA